jgi:gas vesicle protein
VLVAENHLVSNLFAGSINTVRSLLRVPSDAEEGRTKMIRNRTMEMEEVRKDLGHFWVHLKIQTTVTNSHALIENEILENIA